MMARFRLKDEEDFDDIATVSPALEDGIMRRLDRNFRWLMVIIACLLVGGVTQFITFTNDQARQDRAAMGQCRRVQRFRDFANYNFRVTHDEIETTSQILSAVAPKVVGQRADLVALAGQLRQHAAQMLYDPPTNCVVAVRRPESYIPPLPVPYAH